MRTTEWILLFILSLLWGGSFFFSAIALRDIQPFTLVLGRVSVAAIALLSYVYLSGEEMPTSPRLWGELLLMGMLNNLIPFSLIVWGQTQIDSSLAAILNATTPVFTVILAHLLTRDEKLTANRFLGVILGLGGVVVLLGLEALHGLNLRSLGQVAVVAAALSYSCAGIYGRRFKQLSPVVAATGMVTCTAAMMLPIALIFERHELTKPSPIT